MEYAKSIVMNYFSDSHEEKKDDDGDVVVIDPPPAIPPGAAATSIKNDKQDSPRRTGRKRTSTTMIIDGHVVKTANNYVVKGDRYVSGAFEADAPQPTKKKAAVATTTADQKPSAPRKIPDYIKQRGEHNTIIKQRIANDDSKRLNFMTRNLAVLEPFVDDKVKATLVRNQHKVAKEAEPELTVLGTQPDAVQTTLRDYQMVGLDWMIKMHQKGMPWILGDEMGLGKTLQTISVIAHLKENIANFNGPSLVICPLSVLYSWCAEVKKHAPSLKCFRFHASDPNEREQQKHTMMHEIMDYDIVVTTYEMAKNPQIVGLIRNTYFNLCVLDEGHVIKSLTSQISEAVRKIHCQTRVILTGTPLQNNLVELYAILNFLYPQYFTTPTVFEDAFDITHNRIDPDMLLKANKLLQKFMIRRLKGEVEKLMPKKIETKILCPLSSSQIFWYKGYLMNEVDSIVKMMEEKDPDALVGKGAMLRNLVMQLRKVCLHPYLFDFAEPNMNDTTVEELVATSGKLAVLDKLLMSLFKKGHRTCIFSQFTSMLNILEDYCILRGWKYCRFDGGTPRAQRNHIINQFNAPGSTDFIFLMSTRSGGLGINLQTADTCILFDSDWNPQPDLQAMARVHRIGQKKTVHVYRLVSAGTVEERIVERAEKKLYLDQMVNRGVSNGAMDNDDDGVTSSELLASLTFGSNAIFKSDNDLPTDSDISRVTDRTRSEESSEGLLQGGALKTASDYDKDKELTDTRNFCGVDFRKLREEKEQKFRGKGSKTRNKMLDNLKSEWMQAQTGETEDEMGKGKRNRKSRLLQIASNGSGWGQSHVPVLAINDYDLQSGEPSVWRETKKSKIVPQKKKVNNFINQDFCQICGEGGLLIECPRCPVSVHSSCSGLHPDDFQCCNHHHCITCGKNANGAGGLIYRCQACTNAYCPDCMPAGNIRFLGTNVPRFEKLGFTGNNLYQYIHCSKQCEEVAKAEFGFKEEAIKPKVPRKLDVSYSFGANAMDVKDMAKMYREKAMGVWQSNTPSKGARNSPRMTPSKGARSSPRKTPRKMSPKKDFVDLTSPSSLI